MEGKNARFKYRRINGITEVRLRDSNSLRRQLMMQFQKLAPLLDDYNPGEPSFPELKQNPELRRFLDSLGDETELVLFVSARGDTNLEKAVGVVDYSGRICAVVHWKADGNSTEFKIFN